MNNVSPLRLLHDLLALNVQMLTVYSAVWALILHYCYAFQENSIMTFSSILAKCLKSKLVSHLIHVSSTRRFFLLFSFFAYYFCTIQTQLSDLGWTGWIIVQVECNQACLNCWDAADNGDKSSLKWIIIIPTLAFKLREKAVHVIVLRSKDARPSVEGRMSFGRGTHVLRSKDEDLDNVLRKLQRPFSLITIYLKRTLQRTGQQLLSKFQILPAQVKTETWRLNFPFVNGGFRRLPMECF